MNRFVCNGVIGFAIAFALAGASALGATQALGAHPFWSLQVVLIGLAIGVSARAATWPVQQYHRRLVGLYLLGALVAAGVTVIGKDRFVSSYAEDYVGGRMWYYGWIAVSGFVFAGLWQILAHMLCPSTAATQGD